MKFTLKTVCSRSANTLQKHREMRIIFTFFEFLKINAMETGLNGMPKVNFSLHSTHALSFWSADPKYLLHKIQNCRITISWNSVNFASEYVNRRLAFFALPVELLLELHGAIISYVEHKESLCPKPKKSFVIKSHTSKRPNERKNVKELRYILVLSTSKRENVPVVTQPMATEETDSKIVSSSFAIWCRHIPVIRFLYPSKSLHQKWISQHSKICILNQYFGLLHSHHILDWRFSGVRYDSWATWSLLGWQQEISTKIWQEFTRTHTHPPTVDNVAAEISAIRMNAKWRKMDLNHLLQFHYCAMWTHSMEQCVASEIFIDFVGVDSFTSSCLFFAAFIFHVMFMPFTIRMADIRSSNNIVCSKWKKISTHNESKDIHAPLRLDGFTSWLCLGVLVCCKLNGERKNKTAMWIKQTGINLEVVPWLCNNPTKSTRLLIGQPLWVSAGTLSVGSENKTSLLTFHL